MNTVSIDDIFHPVDPDSLRFLTTVSSFGGPDDLKDNPNPEFKFGDKGRGYKSSMMPDGSLNPIPYVGLPPGLHQYIEPGSEFDIMNPKNGKKMRVVYKEEGPVANKRGIDASPNVLNELGLDTDDRVVVDFSPAFGGQATTEQPSPPSQASGRSRSLSPKPYSAEAEDGGPDDSADDGGNMPQGSAEMQAASPSGEEEQSQSSVPGADELSYNNARGDFSHLDPRALLIGKEYKKSDIVSYNEESGAITYKDGLEVNPKQGTFIVRPGNGKQYLYSARHPTEIVSVTDDPNEVFKGLNKAAMEKALKDFGVSPLTYGVGTSAETPESKKAYMDKVAQVLQAGGQGKEMSADIREAVHKQEEAQSEIDWIDKKVVPLLDKFMATGKFAKLASYVMPRTTNYDKLEVALQTLSSKIAVGTMLEMKAASKTGATGFGQLSEKELAVLQNIKASLDQRLSPETLKDNLKIIKHDLRRSLLKWEEIKKQHGVSTKVDLKTGNKYLIFPDGSGSLIDVSDAEE